MRKGLPFVLLAVMIAALVVRVGSALSLNAPVREQHSVLLAWPVVADAPTIVPAALVVSHRSPARPHDAEPLAAARLPQSVRLLIAGIALVSCSGLARLGR